MPQDELQSRVDDAVGEAVEDAVHDLGDAERRAAESAREARLAEAGALDARAGAEEALDDADTAARAAIDAAALVASSDPLLDTAVRRIEAQASPDKPFGERGRPMSSRSPFRVAFTATLGVALAYGLIQALAEVRSVLILLLVSAFLAIGLDPAVRFFERKGVRRGRAVGIVLAFVLVFFTGFLAAIVPPIVTQADEFAQAVPGYVQDLQENDRIASLNERYGFLDKAEAYAKDPAKLAPNVFGGVVGVGKVVFGAFFSTLTVLILTLYFLASLPSIKHHAYRMVPRTRRSRVGLLTDEILSRVGGYVAGALSIGAIAGVTTFIFCMVMGIDYPLALAMVVAVTGLIPLIGATIGAAVVVLVAFFSSVQVAVIAIVYYLIYQQVENYWLYPKVMSRSVNVSPAATVVAVLIGGSLLGVLGALLAIPIAAAVQLVVEQVVAPRQDEH